MSCYEENMFIFNVGTLHDVYIGALNVLGCAFFSMISKLLVCQYRLISVGIPGCLTFCPTYFSLFRHQEGILWILFYFLFIYLFIYFLAYQHILVKFTVLYSNTISELEISIWLL